MIIAFVKSYFLMKCSPRAVTGKLDRTWIITIIFLISCVIPLCVALRKATTPVQFGEKSLWIQVGNQIKAIDDRMFQTIIDCGFNKIILLNSAVDDRGYFPVLASVIRRSHPRNIKVSMGDLVFKEVYLREYWNQNPSLRKCNLDGSYTFHPYYRYQICPNNPENQKYIAQLLVERAKKFHVDELHIDYECTACYCDYCVVDFIKEYGKNPTTLHSEDLDWLDWRSRRTSRFFQWLAMKKELIAPWLKISATAPIIGTPAGFTEYGIDLRYEDLSDFVDEFVPMIYISDCLPPELAGTKHLAIMRRLPGKSVTPGLMLAEERNFHFKSASRIEEEMKYVHRAGARNIVFFEMRFINDELKKILHKV